MAVRLILVVNAVEEFVENEDMDFEIILVVQPMATHLIILYNFHELFQFSLYTFTYDPLTMD